MGTAPGPFPTGCKPACSGAPCTGTPLHPIKWLHKIPFSYPCQSRVYPFTGKGSSPSPCSDTAVNLSASISCHLPGLTHPWSEGVQRGSSVGDKGGLPIISPESLDSASQTPMPCRWRPLVQGHPSDTFRWTTPRAPRARAPWYSQTPCAGTRGTWRLSPSAHRHPAAAPAGWHGIHPCYRSHQQ